MLDQIREMTDGTIISLYRTFEAANLTKMHSILAIVGALLSVYVMNLISYEHEDEVDPSWLRWVRRSGLMLVALAFGWTINYSFEHNWQPWPPEILLMVGVDLGLVVRVVAIHLRIHREGSRRHRHGTPSSSTY
jgi:hypothetical protein